MNIAIVGTAPSSNMLAPYNDPDWEIWVCSSGNMNVVPRANAWFELHTCGPDGIMSRRNIGKGLKYLRWLGEQKFPVYMQTVPNQYVPNAVEYPIKEMKAKFGVYFWSSSPAYMIALAIAKGPTRIGLWGIDMAADKEYAKQRPDLLHFIDVAQREGIEIVLPLESDLTYPPPMYAYSFSTAMGRKMHTRVEELSAMHKQAKQNLEELKTQEAYFRGSKEALEYCERTFS